MSNMKSWMMGAAVVAAGMGMAAMPAQAAEFGVHLRGPVAYIPPCPGPGYAWVAGYQAEGYWIPGRWAHGGHREPVVVFHEDFGRDRGFYGHIDNGREHCRR